MRSSPNAFPTAASTWTKDQSLSQISELSPEKMFHCYRPTMKNRSTQISTHTPEVTHSPAAPSLCVFFLPSQPGTFSDLKHIPSSPRYLTMPSSLPLDSRTWPPEQEGNVHSCSVSKQVTDIAFCAAGSNSDPLMMLAPKTNFLEGWLQSRIKGTISSCWWRGFLCLSGKINNIKRNKSSVAVVQQKFWTEGKP